MSGINNEEAILARSEARRRRILENSKSRLEKIACRNLDDIQAIESIAKRDSSKENIVYPDPEVEHVEFENMFSQQQPLSPPRSASSSGIDTLTMLDMITNMQRSQSAGLFNADIQSEQVNGGGGLFGAFPSKAESKQLPQSNIIRFLQSKFHFILLSLVTYLGIVNKLVITSNVFFLFLLWEIFEVFLCKTYETNRPSFLPTLFLLGGIPPIHSTIFLKFFETMHKILKDLAIFMFGFVLIHIFWLIIVLDINIDDIATRIPDADSKYITV